MYDFSCLVNHKPIQGKSNGNKRLQIETFTKKIVQFDNIY